MENFTIVDLGKKIEAENAEFEKMSKAEKRVVIAKDCLVRIKLEQINPSKGRFCSLIDDYAYSHLNIKTVLNSESTNLCSACAKGSLFLSYVGRVNNITFNQIQGFNGLGDSDHKKLLEIFTARQLSLIEIAFEGHQYISYDTNNHYIDFSEGIIYKIEKFREKHNYNAESILIDICNNIITNKGTFKM
jgi:hypothetical protein